MKKKKTTTRIFMTRTFSFFSITSQRNSTFVLSRVAMKTKPLGTSTVGTGFFFSSAAKQEKNNINVAQYWCDNKETRVHSPLGTSQIDYTVIKAFREGTLAANSKPLFSAISPRGGSIRGKKRNISTRTCDFIVVGALLWWKEWWRETSRLATGH